MLFNKRELAAILNIANGMAEIDGKVEDIELDVIYSEMTSRLGLEHDELLSLSEIAMIDMDPHTAMNIVAEMSPFQKQYVQALLVIVMASDGNIDEREMAMLKVITMVSGLPPINMNDIRTTVNAFRNRRY